MDQFMSKNPAAFFVNGDNSSVVKVCASVDINASPEVVYELITDLNRKTKLCPHTSVIRISWNPPGAVDVGTIYHHRVAIDGHVADYQNHVVELEVGRRMVTQSNTDPSFRVEVIVEPIPSGARLTQIESFPLAELVIPVPKGSGWFGNLLRWFFGEGDIRQGEHVLTREADEMQSKLQPRLEAWLKSIQRHLEKQEGKLFA
ncbi:MAG: hypothetical protein BMS9Abin33_0640 [Gammaproteobacteria bacterium]|nr:MAG: hypothetical protein BMS9Abin33_0640 [Gammaproteobacteria bacterium]